MADRRGPFASVRSLILIGVGAYVVFVLATLPARVAFGWFAPDNISASGLAGSVWNGSALSISSGQTRLGACQWRARPLSLLRARAGFRVEARFAGGTLVGNVATGFGNRIWLDDVRGILPMAALAGVVPVAAVDGRIGLSVEQARLKDGWPVSLQGTVDLANLFVTAPVRTELGSFQLVFAQDDNSGAVTAAVSDVESPLTVSGTLDLLAERGYDLNLDIIPKPASPQDLRDALTLMTGPPEGSAHKFALSGTL